MDRVDAVVVGAGVVGLACARSLAMRGLETVILERHDHFGMETSSRNSEVIHAGIYYPAGSLKARLCVSGRDALYAFCERNHVAYKRCGKLIVATSPEQEARLLEIREHAIANGVCDLRMLDRREALAMEPALHCTAALLSPSTGIIDSHAFMLALLGEAERHGAVLATRSTFTSATVHADGINITVGGSDPFELAARVLVNAAGLSAQKIAASIDPFPAECLPPAYYAKGNYFSLSGRPPFSRLIYPVPEPGGLGVHLTLDMGGQARFGPDVEWVDAIDYEVSPQRGEKFYAEVRKYWPDLPDDALRPAFSGMRPKLSGKGEPAADFLIQGPKEHGVPGLVNLFGIESPGLTSSLAIADEVSRMLV